LRKEKEYRELDHLGHGLHVKKVGIASRSSLTLANTTRWCNCRQERHLSLIHGEAYSLQEYARKRLLNPESVQVELQMLRLVCQNHHPNIIELHDFWETENEMFIVMELCAGDLQHVLRSPDYQPLPRRLLWEITYQIGSGLEYLHSIGVCHRDLKPENGACPPRYGLTIIQYYSCRDQSLSSRLPTSELHVSSNRPVPEKPISRKTTEAHSATWPPRYSTLMNTASQRMCGDWAASCCSLQLEDPRCANFQRHTVA
jgi:Protein kinase domain